ncbi:MAG: FMN-binding protein [Tissierellia bacterium]|nr:FMN-binding protein [Tissierellia bacterium]
MTKQKSTVYPIIFMLILTVFIISILAGIDYVTKDKIEFNKDIELKKKILNVFGILDETKSPEEIAKIFDDEITAEDDSEFPVYNFKENGELVAYAVPFHGPGLWGSIDGYIGIKKDLETITGIEFIKQDETPGLGGRISEAPYKEQYRDLKIDPNQEIYIISRPAPGGNVDAIAGATQTSTFVTNMVNKDLSEFINERKGK